MTGRRDFVPPPLAPLGDGHDITHFGRLALDKQLHGQGLGGVLLAEALSIAAQAAASIAAAFVVVDALNEKAAEFYLHYGFTRLPGTNRLVLKVATIASA